VSVRQRLSQRRAVNLRQGYLVARKLAAYTRVEFSPQADALIAALRARVWVEPPAGAFILG
jgi:hypothetical protein